MLALTAPAAAIVLPVAVRLTIEVGTIAPLVFESTGFATVNGSGGGVSVASLALGANAIGGTTLVPITDPGADPITGVRATVGNAPGTLVSSGGSLGGVLPLAGVVKVCIFGQGGCDSPAANLSVPLTPIGAGGLATAMGVVNVSVFGAPWTAGTAAVGTTTRMGYALGPASATGSTAQVGGRLQLVTPIYVSTNIGASVSLPAFATLTLHFVPEPTTLALLAAGVGGLGWRGARRSRVDRGGE